MAHDPALTIAANVMNTLIEKEGTMNKDQITYFEVDRYGCILYPDFYEIKTRDDAYDLSLEYDFATPERLISFAEDCPPLQWEIGSHYTEYREDPA